MEGKQQPERPEMAEGALHYMVCHDGSQASIDALNTVYKGMMKDKDHLTCANVWSIEKEEYLKYDMKHQYIKETTEAHCSGIGKRYTWYDHEMQ